MSLEISVGALVNMDDPEGREWLRESLSIVNTLLKSHGYPPHHEPEVLPDLVNRSGVTNLSYSCLHFLRRMAAHNLVSTPWMPVGQANLPEPTEDPVYLEHVDRTDRHLLCHSDAEGFYVPVDFPNVLEDETETVPGIGVGSSFALFRELIELAPVLGICLNNGVLSDAEASRIVAMPEDHSLQVESIVWLWLFEAARLSLEHRAVIWFH